MQCFQLQGGFLLYDVEFRVELLPSTQQDGHRAGLHHFSLCLAADMISCSSIKKNVPAHRNVTCQGLSNNSSP